MNQIAVVAKVPLVVGGRAYAPGDRLVVSAVRYGAWLVMGKVALASSVRVPPATDAPVVETVEAVAETPRRRARTPRDPNAPKRVYRRRDLQAEG